VPRFQVTRLVRGREIVGQRAVCDGCDPVRPCDEHADRAELWLVTAGAFELRDRDGVHAMDPTHAIVLPRGHEFTIRHPAGPDTCVAFHGPLIERIAAERGPGMVAITATHAARLAVELAAPVVDELAVGEIVSTIGLAPTVPARDRDLAAAVAHELRLTFAEPTSLSELAERTGYSLFHTCRVFRATTGQTIHGFRRELRLRHALARILDGGEPLVQIAAQTGFASQSHLTNLFRARFGITPARARSGAGRRKLAA
jgi:AraC-like DNA-binding protein